MNKVLVLCEGNICRSPMAESLLSAQLPGWRVESAGLNALLGSPADAVAVELMRERGLDITGHRATQVTRMMCLDSTLVLVMEKEQRRRLEKMYPEACGRVFRLTEDDDVDVPDPYRRPETAFRTALTLIDKGVSRWVQRIQRL